MVERRQPQPTSMRRRDSEIRPNTKAQALAALTFIIGPRAGTDGFAISRHTAPSSTQPRANPWVRNRPLSETLCAELAQRRFTGNPQNAIPDPLI